MTSRRTPTRSGRRTTLRALFGLVGLCCTIGAVGIRAEQGGRASADEQLVLTSTRDDAGSHEYRVSRRTLTATRPWLPESQPPPLSIDAALATAKKRANLPRSQDFMLTAITLHPHPLDTDGGVRWYYNIEYYDLREIYADKPPLSRRVLILMDGSIVEPVDTSSRF